MSLTQDKTDKFDLPEPPGENPHYLRAISELGETEDVFAESDIYAKNGIKLLSKGARISRKQFDHLAQHKLSISLDHSVTVSTVVDAKELAREAGRLLEHNAMISLLANRTGDPLAVKHELAALDLPHPMKVRLTAMRATRRELFDHSVQAAMITFALAQQLHWAPNDLPTVLLAALCHDMGELHTDPALLVTEHRITPEEMRFVYVHPITAYVLLNEGGKIPPAVTKAVLQHHERLDGSGYPYGLKGEKISPLAKLLAVADVAQAGSDRFESHRMDMLLRVSRNRFSPEILNILRDLIRASHDEEADIYSEIDTASELGKLAKILDTWSALKLQLELDTVSTVVPDSPLSFLFERIDSISRVILQAGFDLSDIPGMASIAGDDAQILTELRDMLCEMDWLLRDLANEIERRHPHIPVGCQAAMKAFVELLRSTRLTGYCVIWPMR